MLLRKSKKVIRTKGIPFPESKLSSSSAKENFHQLYSKHCFFSYSFSLKLSLVFVCRENTRRSGILLFPDCPRFCRLMKTRNCRYPRSSGMDGVKSGESGAFLFSRRVSEICDGRRSFPTNENSVGDVGDGFRSLPIPITNKHGVSRKHVSDCCLERLAQKGKKNSIAFFVGFCLSRIETLH